MLSSKEMRNAIIQAISKRSQTKFAKLFFEFDAEPKKKASSIVLLLAELNEQKDFYVDFNVHLRYFLDLYEELAASNKTFLFNEAGLLVHNATRIYERRLECVLQRVEDQLASLSNGQESTQNNANEEEKSEAKKTAEEKPTKKRRRLVESTQDPFDFQWTRRKFKKLADDKRFGPGTKIDRSKLMAKKLHVENYLHPALWKYAEIVDLENEEEVDSKRNYRLFTSYVEHRYNTLVPDINFRLYYKMKDYLDADERDDEHINNSWPPLSQAFVKQYLKMEDRALAYVQESAKRRRIESPKIGDEVNKSKETELTAIDSGISLGCSLSLSDASTQLENSAVNGEAIEEGNKSSNHDTAEGDSENSAITNVQGDVTNDDASNKDATNNESHFEAVDESDLGAGIADSAALSAILDSTVGEIASSTALHSTEIEDVNASNEVANENSEAKSFDNNSLIENENLVNKEKSCNTIEDATQTAVSEQSVIPTGGITKETVELTVHIETEVSSEHIDYLAQASPQNDEGVCFSDLDDGPISPLTIQVERSVVNDLENKTAETVEVNVNNLQKFNLQPHQTPVEYWPIKLNIFAFPLEVLRKIRRPKLLTDLGEEMELYLKARCYKRTRVANESSSVRKIQLFDRSASSASFVYITPPPSPCNSVLLGFGEEGKPLLRPRLNDERLSRLSLDSGVENDLLTATPEKNTMFFPPIVEHDRETEEAGVENTAPASLDKENVGRNLFESEDNTPKTKENAPVVEDNTPIVEDQTPTLEDNTSIVEDKTPTVTDNPPIVEDATAPLGIEDACDETDHFMDVAINLNSSEPLDDASTLDFGDKHLELCDDTVAKIQTWHRKLQPILAQSRERHHFDVFQIGTNIIGEFKAKPNEAITFQDVMKDQDPSYVSRYFLSSLLLANQGNLALKVRNKSDDRPSDWSDVHFKLLSTTRHVVAVEDNIGLLPTTKSKAPPSATPSKTAKSTSPTLTPPETPAKKAMSPKLLPPPVPAPANSRKRKSSVAATAAAYKVNLKGIETIKPISKAPRLSFSNDSGIASNESDFYEFSS